MKLLKQNTYLLVAILGIFVSTTSCSSDDNGNEGGENTRVLQVEKADGSLFEDGEIITFNEVGFLGNDDRDEPGVLRFFMRNTSSQNIVAKIEIADIRGSDGSMFTFCVQPLCIFEVTQGMSYPQDGAVIAPNQANSMDDYFINGDSGDEETSTIEYDLRFYVVDENGNESDDLMITYRYIPL